LEKFPNNNIKDKGYEKEILIASNTGKRKNNAKEIFLQLYLCISPTRIVQQALAIPSSFSLIISQ